MDPYLLRRLFDDTPATVWVQTLSRAGVRQDDADGVGGRMYTLARRLIEIEDEVMSSSVKRTAHFNLPRGWWWWVPLSFGLSLVAAAQRDSYEDRLMLWAYALISFGIIASVILVWIKWVPEKANLQRVRDLKQAKDERLAVRTELLALRDQLVEAAD